MNRNDVTEMIVAAKIQRGLRWADVAAKVGKSKGDRVKVVLSGRFLPYKSY